MKKTLISIMILFAIVFSLSAKDDPLLDFINNLFTGKIPYTTESFVKQGFVSVESFVYPEQYETVWNDQFVVIQTAPKEKKTLIRFSQIPPIVPDKIKQPYKKTEPDRQKYLKDWQTFFNYFSKKHKVVSVEKDTYHFKNFEITNASFVYQFYISDQIDR